VHRCKYTFGIRCKVSNELSGTYYTTSGNLGTPYLFLPSIEVLLYATLRSAYSAEAAAKAVSPEFGRTPAALVPRTK